MHFIFLFSFSALTKYQICLFKVKQDVLYSCSPPTRIHSPVIICFGPSLCVCVCVLWCPEGLVVLAQEQTRHIFKDKEGDAARGNHSHQIGNHPFVKPLDSFIAPRSPDHIHNSTVVIVLVLQASAHNLVWVRHCHCKYFGDGCYGDVL